MSVKRPTMRSDGPRTNIEETRTGRDESSSEPRTSSEPPRTSSDEPPIGENQRLMPMLEPSQSQTARDSRPVTAGGESPRANVRDGLPVKLEKLRAFYGAAEQVKGIDLDFNANEVTAIIGPSGCGKSP